MDAWLRAFDSVSFCMSGLQGVVWVCTVAVIFVGSIYLWPTSRSVPRDDSREIVKRVTSVGVACGALVLLMVWAGSRAGAVQWRAGSCPHSAATAVPVWRWIGVDGQSMGLAAAWQVVWYCIVTLSLFLGPIVQEWGTRPWIGLSPGNWKPNDSASSLNLDLITLRNYVFGPLYEEWAFRGIMIPPILSSGLLTELQCILILPWTFGVAHVHHVYQRIRLLGEDAHGAAIGAAFQLSYTTLFGAYSTFLFLRTQTLAVPVAVHALCNYMGTPDIGGAFELDEDDDEDGSMSTGVGDVEKRRSWRSWRRRWRRLVIPVCYAAGVVLFSWLIAM